METAFVYRYVAIRETNTISSSDVKDDLSDFLFQLETFRRECNIHRDLFTWATSRCQDELGGFDPISGTSAQLQCASDASPVRTRGFD